MAKWKPEYGVLIGFDQRLDKNKFGYSQLREDWERANTEYYKDYYQEVKRREEALASEIPQSSVYWTRR